MASTRTVTLGVVALALAVYVAVQTVEIYVDIEIFIEEDRHRVFEVFKQPGKMLEFHKHRMEVTTDIEETIVNGQVVRRMTFLQDVDIPIVGTRRIVTEGEFITTKQELLWNTTLDGRNHVKGRFTFLDLEVDGIRGTLVRDTFQAEVLYFLQWHASRIAHEAHTVLLSNMKDHIQGKGQ